ncbi:MAG: aminoglycoside phosphotransferase family protein [Kofleriaceae bacterium]
MVDLLDESMRRRWFGDGAPRVAVRARPLRGGIEACAVHLITATGLDPRRRRIVRCYVRKVAHGASAREVEIYRRLVHPHARAFAPALLGIERPARGTAVLCLEVVRRDHPWPWSSLDAAAAVLERVVGLHALPEPHPVLPPWDYDAELARSAAATVEQVRRLAARPATAELVRGAAPAIEALAGALGTVRRELLASRPFGGSILHGDLHPGNVVVHRRGPVLIDWARARTGSALEDVSSWLESLAYWEPEARRRHDTLLVRYLAARGLDARITGEIRAQYWLAAAGNALSGALGYHLAVAAETRGAIAARSAACARDWIRIVRRARAQLR